MSLNQPAVLFLFSGLSSRKHVDKNKMQSPPNVPPAFYSPQFKFHAQPIISSFVHFFGSLFFVFCFRPSWADLRSSHRFSFLNCLVLHHLFQVLISPVLFLPDLVPMRSRLKFRHLQPAPLERRGKCFPGVGVANYLIPSQLISLPLLFFLRNLSLFSYATSNPASDSASICNILGAAFGKSSYKYM